MVQKQRIRYCAIVLHCADRLQCRACELTQDSLFGGFGGYLVIARPVIAKPLKMASRAELQVGRSDPMKVACCPLTDRFTKR